MTNREGSHSGQLHEFRKLEGAIPTQVQILYPPPSLAVASFGGQSPQEDREGEMLKMFWYVYSLKCNDDKPYIGCTDNLKNRIKRHNNKQVKLTKDKLPIKLIAYFAFKDKYVAFNFEKYLKSGSGRAFLKKRLI